MLQRYENALYATGNRLDGGNASSNNARDNHPSGIMGTKMCVRNDTQANWESNNPVLGAGEIGYDTTNDNFKIGDGTTAWNSLKYMISYTHNIQFEVETAWRKIERCEGE